MKKVAGIVTGTGAALNVEVGFKPSKVTITNKVTRTKIECIFTTVTSAVADVNGVKQHTETVTASGIATDAAGARTVMTAGHLAQYAGADGSEAKGFTIAAAATPNVNANDIVWEAEMFD